jgi:hypothetical protein
VTGGKFWALLLAAIMLSPLLAACSSSSSAAGNPQVVGIGDSMLRIAVPDIGRTLGSGYKQTMIARSGQRIDQMLPDLEAALRDHRPVAAVIENLGTNNAIQAARYGRSLADFDRLIADTAPVGCVVLTTVNTFIDRQFGHTIARDINTRIRRLHQQDARKYPIVDWDALIHAPGGLLRWSGLPPHENLAGEQWFADQYAQALAQCGVTARRNS